MIRSDNVLFRVLSSSVLKNASTVNHFIYYNVYARLSLHLVCVVHSLEPLWKNV